MNNVNAKLLWIVLDNFNVIVRVLKKNYFGLFKPMVYYLGIINVCFIILSLN